MLLAESIFIGPSTLWPLLCLAAGVAGTLFYQRIRTKQATGGEATPLAAIAMKAAFASHKEDLGFLTDLFQALGTNNRAGLQEAITNLGYELKKGTLGDLLEDFVHCRIKVLMSDPTDRKQLLALISTQLGEDIEHLVAMKRTTSITAHALPIAAPLLAMALLLGLTSSAAAYGPERFEPTVRVATLDQPVMHQTKALARAEGAPHGVVRYVLAGPRHDHRVGWWHRGPARRFVSAPFRFWGRWAPLRRLFGRC